MLTRAFAGLVTSMMLCVGVLLVVQGELALEAAISVAASVTAEATAEATRFINGDAERGQLIFTRGVNDAPPCLSCHTVGAGRIGFQLGPSLNGMGERAAVRVAGMTAAAYLRQSILEPGAHVVGGFRNLMYPDFAEHFTEQDLSDLIAFLLTL